MYVLFRKEESQSQVHTSIDDLVIKSGVSKNFEVSFFSRKQYAFWPFKIHISETNISELNYVRKKLTQLEIIQKSPFVSNTYTH